MSPENPEQWSGDSVQRNPSLFSHFRSVSTGIPFWNLQFAKTRSYSLCVAIAISSLFILTVITSATSWVTKAAVCWLFGIWTRNIGGRSSHSPTGLAKEVRLWYCFRSTLLTYNWHTLNTESKIYHQLKKVTLVSHLFFHTKNIPDA